VAENLTATVRTTMGTIVLRLFPEQAPKTVQNFTGLAEGSAEWTDPRTGRRTSDPLYNGTIFHRVIDNFMLQGGDPLGTGTGGPGYEFEDEIHPDLRFDRPYLLAMANAGPGTNGSQFFLVYRDSMLPPTYTVFGTIDQTGLATLDKIAGAGVAGGGDDGEPTQKVTIESVRVD
jgi:peptidyl-prolyl cis-trans isomerase A (cyclophilin A)